MIIVNQICLHIFTPFYSPLYQDNEFSAPGLKKNSIQTNFTIFYVLLGKIIRENIMYEYKNISRHH